MERTLKTTYYSLAFNLLFSTYHFLAGIFSKSWWLLTLGGYYFILSLVRFFVIRSRSRRGCLLRTVGIFLLALCLPLAGTVILSVLKDRGQQFPQIQMITMAVYAFGKITLATVNLIKLRHSTSVKRKALTNISFANAFVSIFALQRSMLVSFGEMRPEDIQLFNILTGTAVWIVVLFLGMNLIGGNYLDMAKSKLIKINKKIAEGVTSGYKKIEKGVVNSYTKIEDKFVDAFLTKDDESVEDAKTRLKNEKK